MLSSEDVESRPGRMGPGAERHLTSCARRIIMRWGGPRLIDAPIRLYAVLTGVVATLVSGGIRPDAEMLSLLCLAIGAAAVAAVTLSYLRITLFLVLSGLVVAEQLLASVAVSGLPAGTFPGVQESTYDGFAAISLAWMLGGALGLASAWTEARISSAAQQRELRYDHALASVRLNLALDAHDVISHGLAAESAIIRMIGADARQSRGVHPRLTELALINAHTQQQLRLLVARLIQDSGEAPGEEDFAELLAAAADTMRSAAEAGGFQLALTLRAVPSAVPAAFAEPVLAMMKELVTNIVKHASSSQGCSLELDHRLDEDGRGWLQFTSRNDVVAGTCLQPGSLSARAAVLGGTCRVECGKGRYVVVVTVPVPRPEESLPRTSDVRVGDSGVSW